VKRILSVLACNTSYQHCLGVMVIIVGVLLLSVGGNPVRAKAKGKRIAARRHHLPMQLYQMRDQTTAESYNRSGYGVLGPSGSVTDVKASWVEPFVGSTCSSVPDGYAAFWTGIDGWTSNTVEQIGTDSDCVNLEGTQTGTPTYYAWFEFYPQDSYLVGDYSENGICESDCVSPGDRISAEVRFGGWGIGRSRQRGGQQFILTITDQTRGWSFATSSSMPGALRTSAEWITEKPNGCPTAGGFCELSDFGIVGFGREFAPVFNGFTNYATVSGLTGTLGSFGASVQRAVLVNYPSGTTIMAHPFRLQDDGTSFLDDWHSAGP
jgi:hypothetical protein